jgi:choline dehydrogenase-like flavoprotein
VPTGKPRLAQDPLAGSRSAAGNPAELPIDAGRQGYLGRRAQDRARHLSDRGNAETRLEGIFARRMAQNDEDFLDHIRQTAGTTYHPTSTCMMGQHERAVVDAALRVRGVEGLRVIDASIMPTVVSGNTNAATIMIAEKGADMILAAAKDTSSTASARAA